MKEDQIKMIASWILAMTPAQLQMLRTLLMDGGDPAGVGAVLPPSRPLSEDGAEVEFERWPAEYWESQA